MKTIDDLLADGVSGKRVFVRADLNVPLDGTTITDDGRIRAVAPTIARLAEAGARVIVASHLGRPKGAPDPAFSLAPAAERLGDVLGRPVAFAADTVGDAAKSVTAALADGEVAVLENLRFNPGETSKDDAERGAFADELAALADVYVGDGFGAVHRKHASVFDLPARLPHAAGDLIATEVGVLKKLTEDVARPYAVVLGGAKVSDKLGVIDNLLGKADRILIGGGMAYTFLKAQGHEVGISLLQEDQVPVVQEYLKRAEAQGVEFVLPVDVLVAPEFPDLKTKAPANPTTVAADAIPADQEGLDIGPETRKLYAEKLADAATVFWNGPMGVFEHPDYAEGTRAVARALVDSPAFSVVGGGDSAAAVRTLGFDENAFGHISTGGGASLEYLEGKTLPGLAALED
ncbi:MULTISPECIES: phosphoglycerate kinase [Streptomyces]|uniref:Phosphoglycerate kinase n=1 Tax=Streptomyces tsukubensis (strain DSM 42081 / NBRC 108919 / NRRL 18488 / 9993) TaxID=1114943 RepID=I2MWF9_STRT9|nr:MULTISPECIES: phosphoglycerate kinase [Streptomyces]AZK93536.1 phosphoglycerate kinase [Streptomyces tsukubensis]EIF89106.1 phosphoglycerate kinase [Streptomyces tsukubensis NRRL18488]MYS68667.1 phosphoglycerate kinase [Streptomyces sp. SID5473]QKM70313.1 phosphoglycerate kinase [Streptomyces tsukubensis NRRL18488]TAI45702.1 phosphoglycerate kinase [Streptomyces tsukubensis]